MSKLPSVSVGLAAFNEEKNIQKILREILAQSAKNYRLEKIYVSCDGCSDRTAELARAVDRRKIEVIENHDRKGKIRGMRQVFTAFAGDILVIFDADEHLGSKHVIEKLVEAFTADPKVMLVGGNTQPVAPEGFFQRAVYSTFVVFEQSRKTLHGGHNIFGCNGGCMGLRKEYAKSLRLPKVTNEDDYIFFTAQKRGLGFRHVAAAKVYYKLPKTLTDYLKQSFRSDPGAVEASMAGRFGNLVENEYHRPLSLYMRFVARAFWQNPVGTLYMIVVRALCKPLYPIVSRHYKLSWYTAASTK